MSAVGAGMRSFHPVTSTVCLVAESACAEIGTTSARSATMIPRRIFMMSSLSPDDPLRQLDLLGGVQERAPARFAQKELERVGARLVGAPVGGPLLLRLQSFDEFDPAPLQFAHQLLRLRRIELERRDDRVQLRPLHRATQLRALEQALHLLEAKDRLDLVRHGARRFLGAARSARSSRADCESPRGGLRDKEERRRSAASAQAPRIVFSLPAIDTTAR